MSDKTLADFSTDSIREDVFSRPDVSRAAYSGELVKALFIELDALRRDVNIREIRMRQAETRQEAAEAERDALRADNERLSAEGEHLIEAASQIQSRLTVCQTHESGWAERAENAEGLAWKHGNRADEAEAEIERLRVAVLAYDDALRLAARRGQRTIDDDPNLDKLYEAVIRAAGRDFDGW